MSTISTFGSFTQARLGIYAAQKGLSVTGNNISNINTPGYTRQRLDQTSFYAGGSDRYYSVTDNRIGNGALCKSVSQLRDPYLDIRYRSMMSNVGAMDAKLGGLEGIQAILDEVGDGEDDFGILGNQIHSIYDALEKLSDQTGHAVYDTQVRAECTSLAKEFNAYASQLAEKYNHTVTALNQDIETVNNILTSIRDLNATIRKAEIHGDNALELRDERNMLIDQLSEYMAIDVVYSEEDLGAGQTVEKLTINLGNANPDGSVETDSTCLVDGIYAAQFGYTQVPKANPQYDPDPNVDANALENCKFLKEDGTGTNVETEAQKIDDPNFRLTVSELKDSKDRVQYTIEKGDRTEVKQGDPDYAAAKAGKSTSVTDDKGVTTITVFQKSGTNYYKQVYTRTPSMAVNLDDNDLYGALQSTRELLTEAGEFTAEDTIANVDENAASKRGIPYYQKALDLLARQFATTLNEANHGYMYNKNGEYIDADGKPVEYPDENGVKLILTKDMELTEKQIQFMKEKGLEVGFNMFSKRGDLDTADGITASNISVSSTWASGKVQIVSTFLRPTADLPVASTDSSNIEHMIALFTTKMDYIPQSVSPDSPDTPMFNGTFDEMWNEINSVLANDMKVTTTLLDTYYASSVSLDTSRDSVSSVDLNDEAMNLMQYSKSYNAACRLMTTLDSVLDKLINGTGMTT